LFRLDKFCSIFSSFLRYLNMSFSICVKSHIKGATNQHVLMGHAILQNRAKV
jgi:hypothetical protein